MNKRILLLFLFTVCFYEVMQAQQSQPYRILPSFITIYNNSTTNANFSLSYDRINWYPTTLHSYYSNSFSLNNFRQIYIRLITFGLNGMPTNQVEYMLSPAYKYQIYWDPYLYRWDVSQDVN